MPDPVNPIKLTPEEKAVAGQIMDFLLAGNLKTHSRDAYNQSLNRLENEHRTIALHYMREDMKAGGKLAEVTLSQLLNNKTLYDEYFYPENWVTRDPKNGRRNAESIATLEKQRDAAFDAYMEESGARQKFGESVKAYGKSMNAMMYEHFRGWRTDQNGKVIWCDLPLLPVFPKEKEALLQAYPADQPEMKKLVDAWKNYNETASKTVDKDRIKSTREEIEKARKSLLQHLEKDDWAQKLLKDVFPDLTQNRDKSGWITLSDRISMQLHDILTTELDREAAGIAGGVGKETYVPIGKWEAPRDFLLQPERMAMEEVAEDMRRAVSNYETDSQAGKPGPASKKQGSLGL